MIKINVYRILCFFGIHKRKMGEMMWWKCIDCGKEKHGFFMFNEL